MPRGFSGRAAAMYLGEVQTAQTTATEATKKTAASTPNINIRERALRHEPEDALNFSGRVATGQNNSSNIVVDRDEYYDICYKIANVDENVAQTLYDVSMEIAVMCQTVFRLPAAVPRCLGISESVKTSLGDLRSITEDALMKARTFAQRIDNI